MRRWGSGPAAPGASSPTSGSARPRRRERVARRLAVGNLAVNDPLAYFAVLDLPMGGWKASGLGRRHGAPGIQRYCRAQSILVSRWRTRRDPHRFPYRRRVTLGFLRLLRLVYGGGARSRRENYIATQGKVSVGGADAGEQC